MVLRRLLGNSRARRGLLTLVLGSGTGNLLALALSPVITRLFDPASFGSFTLLLSIAIVLAPLMSLRLDFAVPLAEDEPTSYSVVYAGLASAALMCTLFTLLFYIVGPSAAQNFGLASIGPWLWAAPVIATAMSLFAVLNALAIRQGRYRAMALRNVVMVGTSLGLQIVGGLLGYGVGGLVLGYALGQLVGAGILLLGSGLRGSAARAGRPPAELREALSRFRRVPVLLAPAGVVNALGLQLPVVLLAYFYSSEVVGWFGLTQRTLAAPMSLIGLSVAQVYLSEAARAYRSRSGQLSAYFWKISKALFVVGVGLAIALVVLGPTVFSFVFGQQWRTSGLFAQALAIALAAQLIAMPLSQTLIIFERNGVQFLWDVFRVISVAGSLVVSGTLQFNPVTTVWVLAITLTLTYGLAWDLSRRTVARSEDVKAD